MRKMFCKFTDYMSEKYHYYTITAALPYANGPLHIGHVSGVYIPSDIYVRYLRRKGKNVIFICGSDEHGVPITIRAKKEGLTMQELVDKYHFFIKECFEKFNISFDYFFRTSSSIHHKTVSDFFKNLCVKGFLKQKVSKQYYDDKEGKFLADRYILGNCPLCGNTNAFGDQCEKCGISLSPNELIKPRSAVTGNSPIIRETHHWFLPLPIYEVFIALFFIKKHWKINVYRQSKSWVEIGLKTRSITRDISWGIPLPIKFIENKVLYVWFDAPIGYISSTIALASKSNYKTNWKKYWKNKYTFLINFIGKDNIVFHCIIFPIMLKAHGDYIMPINIHSNEFLNIENKKISTSIEWAIWLHKYMEDFPEQQDVLRYVLITRMPENKDTNFSWKDYQVHNNSELVGILGNFMHRTIVFTKKFFYGRVPSPSTFKEKDKKVINNLLLFPDNIGYLIERHHFREALNEFMKIARLGNKYLSEEAPWITNKLMRSKTILYVALQAAGMLAQLSEPFLPRTFEKMIKILRIKALPWKLLKNKELLCPNEPLGEYSILLFDKKK